MSLRDEKSARTRAAFLAAARALFAASGYAATPTEAILDRVGVKRGALYHHFRDKAALFEAVCHDLHREAGAEIEAALVGITDPVEALVAGCRAWLAFMARPDVRQILLVDAISVLGIERWNAMDAEFGAGLLVEGVREAGIAGLDPEALAILLNGACFAAATMPQSSVADLGETLGKVIRRLAEPESNR